MYNQVALDVLAYETPKMSWQKLAFNVKGKMAAATAGDAAAKRARERGPRHPQQTQQTQQTQPQSKPPAPRRRLQTRSQMQGSLARPCLRIWAS